MNKKDAKYIVQFISIKSSSLEGYLEVTEKIEQELSTQKGYCGMECFKNEEKDITISYWKDLESIKSWKENSIHQRAQIKGRSEWYQGFELVVSEIIKVNFFSKP